MVGGKKKKSGVTNQEGPLDRCLLFKVMRPELEMAEPLPGVLRQLAHLAVGVRGQGSRPGGDSWLLVAAVFRRSVGSLSSFLLVFPRTAAR